MEDNFKTRSNYEYIKKLDKLAKLQESHKQIINDYIKVFNEYVSSNEQFKYNKTYLNDSIQGFNNMLNIYNRLLKKVKEIHDTLKKKIYTIDINKRKKFYIVVNHLFVIDDDDISLIIEKLKICKLEEMKNTLEKELSLLNLHNFSQYNIVITYYINDNNEQIDFTDKLNIDDDFEFNELIKKYVTKEEQAL